MPKKKYRACFRVSGVIFLIIYFSAVNIIVLNGENIAMFSDSLVSNYRQLLKNSSFFIDNLLLNKTLADRYESESYCLSSSSSSSSFSSSASTSSTTSSPMGSLIKLLFQHSNYSKNSFESKIKYITCELVVEFFCNIETERKYIFSHSLFNCEDLIKPSTSTVNGDVYTLDNGDDVDLGGNNDLIRLINLSPSILQYEIAIKSFMNMYSLNRYGIVYSNSFTNLSSNDFLYYSMLAETLVYRLSADASFTVDFSLPLYDLTLHSVLTSNIQLILLVLRCGEEPIFMSKYGGQILANKINVISVYESLHCSPLVNYGDNLSTNMLSTYAYLYKLVPIDVNMNLASYLSAFTGSFISNLSYDDRLNIPYLLDEIENLNIALVYESQNNLIPIDLLKTNASLNCLINSGPKSNLIFKYCYRLINFLIFGLNGGATYTQIGSIVMPDLSNLDPRLNASVTMIGNSTFQIQEKPTNTSKNEEIFKDILFGVIAVVIFVIIICIFAYIARSRLMRKELSKGPNKILVLPEDLDFVNANASDFISRPNVRENANNATTANNGPNAQLDNISNKSNSSLNSEADEQINMPSIKLAKYKGDIVVVKFLRIPNFQIKNSTMRELRMLRDLRHENLNAFLGCYIDLNSPALIFDYATRGSLQDIILKKDIKLDWNFKWSMLNDLCRGMRYIHHSPIKYHGNLKSRNCVVDSRWVLKLTDFGLPVMYSNQNYSRTLNLSDLLWTAPEHLRQTTIRDQAVISIGSQTGDIYSFSIIMQELIVRGTPFCMMGLTDEEIISKIRKPPPLLRPSVSKTAAPPEYVNIMRDCWSEQPELRPTFDQLYSMFKSLNGDKKVNIVDLMFKLIEQYTNNLEDLVKEKTLKLEEEKKKTEKLLSEMLPKSVAESLMTGGTVPPESFDCVTIYFSDIVGFTTISAYSSPFEVVRLLNDLYTMFDEILTDYDVYKVETIGDAYMVVSGLPLRNGNKHAGEIATMALDLLHNCARFRIKHLPGIPLRLRIGIHSGACVSGVVGLKMPRYCLFGDTVNTASRMESTSQAYRIHVSESAANILNEIGGYKLEFRGETELKGKGKHKTFWLVGKEGFGKELPDPVESEDNHGIDKKLIETIERIKAEQKALGIPSIGEEDTRPTPSILATKSDQKSESNQPTQQQQQQQSSQPQLSTTDELTREKSQVHKKKSLEMHKTSSNFDKNNKLKKINAPSKTSKNDSGFSETTTTANSTPTAGKTLNLDSNKMPNGKAKHQMPDVDSVV